MAIYAIGDVQGCATQLAQLVERIRFNPRSDQLWFVGDLVNRGPDSLAVLRYVRELGDSARVVLGNHDLFLLAVSEGVVALRPKDTIRDVLEADDRQELVAWLRQQPLHHHENSYLMVHAGLLPQWTAEEAGRLACEVETVFTGNHYRTFLHALFHEPVTTWNPTLQGPLRLATIARVFTRIRTCTPAGDTSSFSGPPDEAPDGYQPWFRIPNRRSTDITIITGHWAALGLQLEANRLAVDSGCVWGRQLTAIRLEDRAVFQVDGPHLR
jgi:bis(5'-nucleosyl)-tetraphosphatase (symmetrical)